MRTFLSFDEYFKNKFGEKVAKLSLDGGFTCPNRDGTLSYEGCIFCSERGAGDFACEPEVDLKTQIEIQKEVVARKWKAKKFIAYFQNFTSTYCDPNKLYAMCEEVLEDESIVGISLSARADTLSDEMLDVLEKISAKTFLWLEMGMQSVNEETIKLINRGYIHKVFDDKVRELKKRNIKFLVHIIFGLPFETCEDYIKSIEYVNRIHPFGVKIHSVYIQYDTPLYNYYLKHPFHIIERDEYVKMVAKSIVMLKDDIVIHRITGDPMKSKLFLPLWARDKLKVISLIDRELKEMRTK